MEKHHMAGWMDGWMIPQYAKCPLICAKVIEAAVESKPLKIL